MPPLFGRAERTIVVVGEDHRSGAAEPIVRGALERGVHDCLFVELPAALGPALDGCDCSAWPGCAEGVVSWMSEPVIERTLSRPLLCAARSAEVPVLPIDVDEDPVAGLLPDELEARMHEGGRALEKALVHDRDARFASRIVASDCDRGLFRVGSAHLPGVSNRLRSAGFVVRSLDAGAGFSGQAVLLPPTPSGLARVERLVSGPSAPDCLLYEVGEGTGPDLASMAERHGVVIHPLYAERSAIGSCSRVVVVAAAEHLATVRERLVAAGFAVEE